MGPTPLLGDDLAKHTRRIYRDNKTGKFVKKSTWARSRAQGGKRYVRSNVSAAKRLPKPKTPRPAPRPRLKEFIATLSYSGKSPRTVDFTVIAKKEIEVRDLVAKAQEKGIDSTGADLTWTRSIPWTEFLVSTPEEMDEESEAPPRALAGYVSLR